MEIPGYERLEAVFDMAFDQAAKGKGKERHADERPFHEQNMFETARAHGLGGLGYQTEKKNREVPRLLKIKGKDAAIRELLGVINYAAAQVIFIQDMPEGGE